jgi:hypothetical protein
LKTAFRPRAVVPRTRGIIFLPLRTYSCTMNVSWLETFLITIRHLCDHVQFAVRVASRRISNPGARAKRLPRILGADLGAD